MVLVRDRAKLDIVKAYLSDVMVLLNVTVM